MTVTNDNKLSNQLKQISSQPLECAHDFPEIAQRCEAWWNQSADRPLFFGYAKKPEYVMASYFEMCESEDDWLERILKDVYNKHTWGEAIPSVQIDMGAMAIAHLNGCPREIRDGQTWNKKILQEGYKHAEDCSLSYAEHPFWLKFLSLAERVSKLAAGSFLLILPDWGCISDALYTMRGTAFLEDTIFVPEVISRVMKRLDPMLNSLNKDSYKAVLENGAAVAPWLRIWSDEPYTIPACDISTMLGPNQINPFLDQIEREARTFDRAIYHLDGPEGAIHLDSILEIPEIKAVQFSPTPNRFTAIGYLDIFKKIQAKGRSVYVYCPVDEVFELCDSLKRDSLAIVLRNNSLDMKDVGDLMMPLSIKELDELYSKFIKEYE